MKKTGFALVLILLFHTAFAAFPKPVVTDSTQASLPVAAAVSSSGNLTDNGYEQIPSARFSFTRQLLIRFLCHHPRQHNFVPAKRDWVASIGGFLMGLAAGPIGFGISRLTNNQALRRGASLGFRIFLYLLGIYIALVLAFLLLFVVFRGW